MLTAYAAVTIATIVANAGAATADFSRAGFVLANAAELGVAETWLPLLGALKAAGAAGLLMGLLGAKPLGIAAAIGLVLFFIGALAVHVRARVLYNLGFPGVFLILAVASLVLSATR
jgi:DoxX-like family